MTGQSFIYFDGYCNLCSRTAQIIIRNDKHKRFKLIPLQGVKKDSVSPGIDEGTVILCMNDKTYIKSMAVLKIAGRLRFPWPLLTVFYIIPRFLRDKAYDVIARNRSRWFGKRDSCYFPK